MFQTVERLARLQVGSQCLHARVFRVVGAGDEVVKPGADQRGLRQAEQLGDVVGQSYNFV